MKKILILEASPRKGWSTKAAEAFSGILTQDGYAVETVTLREESISLCTGCSACLAAGEEKCPNHADDAERIIQRMLAADGIAIFTPNYSLQVPARLKILFDRLAYVFHRPRLFGRTSLAVVVQGVYGGGKIVKYIDELMTFCGTHPVKGLVLRGALKPGEKRGEDAEADFTAKLGAAAQRFKAGLDRTKAVKPSLFRVILFRMTRASMKHSPEALKPDKAYYQEKGWFDSGYYYPVRLNPLAAAVGALMDGMMRSMIRKDEKKKAEESA